MLSENDFLWKILPAILAKILPFRAKLSGKYRRFNVIDGSIEMLKNSSISKNFN